MLMLKYCKTGACLLFFTLTAVGVFARSGSEKAKNAVFGGIELPSFTNASAEMHNYLMFSKSDMGICTKPVKLHFSANPDICHGTVCPHLQSVCSKRSNNFKIGTRAKASG